jgi:PIN domain
MGAPRLVYDAGAVIAAHRGSAVMVALHRSALGRGSRPVVPAVVLAQTWRGGPQPRMSRLLQGCSVLPDDEPVARAAGALCGAAGTSDVVDAIVVVTARMLDAAIVTGDPHDVARLADALRWRPTVLAL